MSSLIVRLGRAARDVLTVSSSLSFGASRQRTDGASPRPCSSRHHRRASVFFGSLFGMLAPLQYLAAGRRRRAGHLEK